MYFPLIDDIINLREYLLFFVKAMSIYIIANLDIFGQAYKPIKISPTVKYLIIANNEQNQRRLSWFYNWYDTITAEDWVEYKEIFNSVMPKHKLLFIKDNHHTLIDISIDLSSNKHVITNENNNKILSSAIGCLNPKIIYQNSLK
jgi:hypothetical protein